MGGGYNAAWCLISREITKISYLVKKTINYTGLIEINIRIALSYHYPIKDAQYRFYKTYFDVV